MSRHAAARRPAATTTVALTVLLSSLTIGIPAAWYGITRDWAVTGRTILLAAVVTGIAVCLLWIASSARGLLRAYRRQP